MLHLREKDKTRLEDIIRKTISEPVEVWAYGSRITGESHDGSDLDIIIKSKKNKPTSVSEFSNLIDAIRDSNIPILVDVKDWHRIPDYFKENIKRQHVVLFDFN